MRSNIEGTINLLEECRLLWFGNHVRDWLFVEDHCRAIDQIVHIAEPGKSYCVGAGNEVRNIELFRKICHILDEEVAGGPSGLYERLIMFVKDRLATIFDMLWMPVAYG